MASPSPGARPHIPSEVRETSSDRQAMTPDKSQHIGSRPPLSLVSSALLKLQRHQETRQARLGERSKRRSAKRSGQPHDATSSTSTLQDLSCAACRSAKVKCVVEVAAPSSSPQEDAVRCKRCQQTGRDCSFPVRQKRGPKGPSRRRDDVDLAVEQLQSYLLAHADRPADKHVDPHTHDSPTTLVPSISSSGRQAGDVDVSALSRQRMSTVAGVTANVPSVQAPRIHDSTSADDLPETGPAAPHRDLDAIFGQISMIVDVEASLIVGSAALYEWVTEKDRSLDPVSVGILSSDDLDRLIGLYFDRMRPFFWHLDPQLHTPSFLRLNSPFLTTTVAAAAASFDPSSAPFAAKLHEHASRLGERCFADGTKSLETALGFDFLCHWSSPPEHLSHDSRWRYHATAMRIAGEIRLDLPFGPHVINSYTFPEGFVFDSQTALERLDRCRSRAWTLLSCGDISLSLQSGRLDFASLQCSGLAPSHSPRTISYHDPDYNFYANQHLNHVLVNAILLFNNLRTKTETEETDQREVFVCAWRPQMIDWQEKYHQRDHFIYLTGLNMEILLCLISLRLNAAEGTTRTLLEHSFMLAVDVVDRTYQWTFQLDAAEQLAYASNYMLINIAYAPVLLLRVADSIPAYDLPDVHEKCERIAAIFEAIDQLRFNATSFAQVYSRQIRSLVEESRQKTSFAATVHLLSDQSALPSNSLLQGPDHGLMPLVPDLSALDATQLAILRSDMWDIMSGFT